MTTPPTMGAVIRSLYSILPLMIRVKAIVATTQPEMHSIVLIPALEKMKRVLGISMLITGKNTQMKAEPTNAIVTLNSEEV